MLNVREDHLQRFAKDTELDAVLPALGNKGVRFKVFYSAALPDFATWRATRAGQGFDARTFEVKARPAAPIAGARPGMSVLVQQASRQENEICSGHRLQCAPRGRLAAPQPLGPGHDLLATAAQACRRPA